MSLIKVINYDKINLFNRKYENISVIHAFCVKRKKTYEKKEIL